MSRIEKYRKLILNNAEEKKEQEISLRVLRQNLAILKSRGLETRANQVKLLSEVTRSVFENVNIGLLAGKGSTRVSNLRFSPEKYSTFFENGPGLSTSHSPDMYFQEVWLDYKKNPGFRLLMEIFNGEANKFTVSLIGQFFYSSEDRKYFFNSPHGYGMGNLVHTGMAVSFSQNQFWATDKLYSDKLEEESCKAVYKAFRLAK